jgi:hypothetical protein
MFWHYQTLSKEKFMLRSYLFREFTSKDMHRHEVAFLMNESTFSIAISCHAFSFTTSCSGVTLLQYGSKCV